MFLTTILVFLSFLEITSSRLNFVFSLFKQASSQEGSVWHCGNRWQTCSVSTPLATMVKAYIFNLLWTMITTVFQKKSNTYNNSKPIIRAFFSKTCLSSFTSDQIHWYDQLCKEMLQHLQQFGALFVKSCDRFLFPFYIFSNFFFLSWFYDSYWLTFSAHFFCFKESSVHAGMTFSRSKEVPMLKFCMFWAIFNLDQNCCLCPFYFRPFNYSTWACWISNVL